MKKIFSLLCGLFLIGFALSAVAADVVTPQKTSDGSQNSDVLIGVNESRKNLYTVGGNVTVNGNTSGDLTAAGGSVSVTGSVEQEVLIAGGNIETSGSIGSNARIAGGNVTVRSNIGGDLAVAGGNVNILNSAAIGGDLLAAGGTVNLEAPVRGSIKIAGGDVTINSTVEGNVNIQGSKSVHFGPNAKISGNIYYKSPNQADVAGGAVVPHLNFSKWQSSGAAWAGLLTLGLIIKLLAWIAVGLLIFALRKNTTLQVFRQSAKTPWENIILGLAVLILTPVVIIAFLFLIIGYYAAALLGAAYVLLLMIAAAFAAFNFGHYAMRYYHKGAENYSEWQAIVLGVILSTLVFFIPILGWIVIALLFLQVLGAIGKLVKLGIKS